MGRESCQGLGLPCFFSAPRVYPTTGCHDGPQDPRNRLWSGGAEESPLHTPKEHLLGRYQTGHSRVPILKQRVNPEKRGFYSLPPGTVYIELAADPVHLWLLRRLSYLWVQGQKQRLTTAELGTTLASLQGFGHWHKARLWTGGLGTGLPLASQRATLADTVLAIDADGLAGLWRNDT